MTCSFSSEQSGRLAPGQRLRDVELGDKKGTDALREAGSWSAGERIDGVVAPEDGVPASGGEFHLFSSLLR
jgi:hypothetical protein